METLDVEDGLRSTEIEVQVGAVEKAAKIVQSLARVAVNGLSVSSDPLFLADKLETLGSAVVVPLRNLLSSSESSTVRILAALVLLQFGDERGTEILLAAVTDPDLGDLVAQRLASKGIKAIEQPIVDWFRNADLNGPAIVNRARAYLTALEMIGCRSPIGTGIV